MKKADAVNKKVDVAKEEKANEPNNHPINITWLPNGTGAIQQVYSKGLEYCFVSKDFKQCFPFVFCKDFLQDALMAMHQNVPVKIYNFEYQRETNEPIHLDKLRIALVNSSDKKFSEKIPHMLDFIRQVEKKLKLVRTVARPIGNPLKSYEKNGAYLVESSSRWLVSPPMISLYTLLLRIGFIHKTGQDYKTTIQNVIDGGEKPYQSHDAGQIKLATAGMDKILKYGYAKVFYKEPKLNYPKISVSKMHNNMGICAFSSSPSGQPKHWHRDLDANKKAKA